MSVYNIYPGVDADYNLPPEVRQALVQSTDMQMTLEVNVPPLVASSLIGGFDIGTVTSLPPGSNPTASISGSDPNKQLNLGLTKGDPGGWITSDLGSINLNNLTAEGPYRQGSTTNGSLANNYPIASFAGVVEVLKMDSSTLIFQRATAFFSGKLRPVIYQRSRINSTVWSPWTITASTRTDQTAGRAVYQWDDLNDREQLIYGDTGWRNINGIVSNRTSGNVFFRIKNGWATVTFVDTVFVFEGTINNFFPVSNSPFLTFAPTFVLAQEQVTSAGTGSSYRVTIFPGGRGAIYSAPSGLAITGSIVWPTDTPWPTILPGVAVGGIPA